MAQVPAVDFVALVRLAFHPRAPPQVPLSELHQVCLRSTVVQVWLALVLEVVLELVLVARSTVAQVWLALVLDVGVVALALAWAPVWARL